MRKNWSKLKAVVMGDVMTTAQYLAMTNSALPIPSLASPFLVQLAWWGAVRQTPNSTPCMPALLLLIH